MRARVYLYEGQESERIQKIHQDLRQPPGMIVTYVFSSETMSPVLQKGIREGNVGTGTLCVLGAEGEPLGREVTVVNVTIMHNEVFVFDLRLLSAPLSGEAVVEEGYLAGVIQDG